MTRVPLMFFGNTKATSKKSSGFVREEGESPFFQRFYSPEKHSRHFEFCGERFSDYHGSFSICMPLWNLCNVFCHLMFTRPGVFKLE